MQTARSPKNAASSPSKKRPEAKPAAAGSLAAKTSPSTASEPTHAPRKPAEDLFVRLVKSTPEAGYQAIHAIRDGFPAKVMKEASGFFGVPEGRIFSIAGVAPTSAYRLLQKGAKIDPAATERVYRMSSITHMAIDVFESRETAIAWMAEPNRSLGDAAPLDLMDTEPGAAAVRLVLNAIATGGVA